MNTPAAPPVAPIDRPVFVLGERAAALQLVRALGDTPTLCAVPANRLLADLVSAAERWAPVFEPSTGLPQDGLWPARWYRDVQAAHLRASGETRTVEFSGLSILRLCGLFPTAQFVVVRQLQRAMPRSNRLPPRELFRILEIDSERVTTRATLERVLAFLGEPAGAGVLDLSDQRIAGSRI